MECEVCGHVASVHVTEVGIAGGTVLRHFCQDHAHLSGYVPPTEQETALAQVPGFRQMAEFIRVHGRMPGAHELPELAGYSMLADQMREDLDLQEVVTTLDRLANFIEAHGRFPDDEELPDVF